MVTPAPGLTDKGLARIRAGGLCLPRAPHPGQRWTPRTPAETHLLTEAQRLDRFRLALVSEVGTLRAQASAEAVRAARDAQPSASPVRAVRPSVPEGCPLNPQQLTALAAAAAGESTLDTSRRLLIPQGTVKDQRKRAVARLGARSIIHAVALCVSAGWITEQQITEGVTP
jgi:DNA-binding CsgD family transcriptional regulator